MTTPAMEQAAWLRAIAEHLDQHPHLAPVNIAGDHRLQIGYVRRVAARALLDWAASLGAGDLRVDLLDNEPYVFASGCLVGGLAVTVWTVVDGFATYLGITESAQVPGSRLGDFAAEHGGGEDR